MIPMSSTNRRGQRLAPIACLVLATLLNGCVATKQDVRLLHSDLAALHAMQDSLRYESARGRGALADSLRATTELLRTTRGQLSNQIKHVEDMLITLQELAGQTQQRINQFREQADRAVQQQAAQQQAPAPAPQASADPDELYRLGATKLQDRSAGAARAVFQQFLAQFPQHEHAPDAQFGLAETYVLDDALGDAVDNFTRVAESYPTSGRASEALYRAGDVSEQRKRPDDARRYYNRVVQRYAGSPSARLAQQKLKNLKK